MKKTLLILLFGLCMLFALSACGGNTDSSGSSSDLVGKWQIKAAYDTSNNAPISIDLLKENGAIESDYDMIIEIDENLNCTLFNGTDSTAAHPVTLTDNGDGSYHFKAEDGSGFNIWTEKNTLDEIEGELVLCYADEGKEVDCYFQKMSEGEEPTTAYDDDVDDEDYDSEDEDDSFEVPKDEMIVDSDGKQIQKVYCTDGYITFNGSFDGSGNFIVRVLDDNQNLEELVCNEIGSYVVDKTVYVGVGYHYIEVYCSDGYWNMTWYGTGGK